MTFEARRQELRNRPPNEGGSGVCLLHSMLASVNDINPPTAFH